MASVTPARFESCNKPMLFKKVVDGVDDGKLCATVPFNCMILLPVPLSNVPPVIAPPSTKIPLVPKTISLYVLEDVAPSVMFPVTAKVPFILIALLMEVALILIAFTVSVKPLLIVSVTALLLPIFMIEGAFAGAVLIFGWLVKLVPVPIFTISPVFGTAPPDQLEAVFQFDDVPPVQAIVVLKA